MFMIFQVLMATFFPQVALLPAVTEPVVRHIHDALNLSLLKKSPEALFSRLGQPVAACARFESVPAVESAPAISARFRLFSTG